VIPTDGNTHGAGQKKNRRVSLPLVGISNTGQSNANLPFAGRKTTVQNNAKTKIPRKRDNIILEISCDALRAAPGNLLT
jgi:hypothetical protein